MINEFASDLTNKERKLAELEAEVDLTLKRLERLGLVVQVEPGKYRITELGRQATQQGPIQ